MHVMVFRWWLIGITRRPSAAEDWFELSQRFPQGKPRMRVAEISSSKSDLVESRQFLRKVRIDVEGSMGPYY